MAKYITHSARERLLQRMRGLERELREIGRKKAAAAGDALSDWHDNFALEQLEREFQMTSKRIGELEEFLFGCQVTKEEEQSERIMIGSTADILLDGQAQTFVIGGAGDSEPKLDLISYDCPVGHLLVGLRVGDSKRGMIGNRDVEVKVLRVHPPSYRYCRIQQQLAETTESESSPEAEGGAT